MPVLQQAQDIYGYLPYEVMQRIAEGLDTSMEEIYGVATFYAQFSLYPKGQYNVSVCLGTACYVKSSGEVMDKLKSLLGVKEGEIFHSGYPLHRLLRFGSRSHSQRGGLRQSDRSRRRRHYQYIQKQIRKTRK